MDVDRHEPGVPSWVDLGSPDVEGAKAFYQGLFGWEWVDLGEEAGGYCQAQLRGRAVAGLGPAQNPGPPYWTVYVAVDDVEATAAKVTAAGGTVIVPPMQVLDAGWMAVFRDGVGAFISVWKANQHIGAQVVNEPGAFTWNELMTDDLGGATTFYGAVFGWTAETHGEDNHGYTEFQLGGRTICGMMERPEGVPAEVPPNWSVYFAVDDCDASMAKVTELGGAVLMGPIDIDQGRFAVVADPQGAVFQIMRFTVPLPS